MTPAGAASTARRLDVPVETVGVSVHVDLGVARSAAQDREPEALVVTAAFVGVTRRAA